MRSAREGGGWRGREGERFTTGETVVLRIYYFASQVRACFSFFRWDRNRHLESLMSWNFLGMFVFHVPEIKNI